MRFYLKLIIPVSILSILIALILFRDIESFKRIVVYGYIQTIKQNTEDLKYSLSLLFNEKDYPNEKIVISKKNYIKLQNQVVSTFNEYALSGKPFSGTDIYYNVDFINNNKINKGRIKLFGMNPDHFANKSGHAFRARYKGSEGYGTKTVNYLKPDTRGYGAEYLLSLIFHKAFDGILIRHDPVRLYFNNLDYGFYYKEDFFDKYLIEDNYRRDNLIFRIYEDSIVFNHFPEEISGDFKNFLEFSTPKNIDINLINLDRVSSLLALAIASGSNHSLIDFNLRWYYNPVINKVEPIMREADIIEYESEIKILENFYTKDESYNLDLSIENIINRSVSINPFLKSYFEKNKESIIDKVTNKLITTFKIFDDKKFNDYDEFKFFKKVNPTNDKLDLNISIIKNNLLMIKSIINTEATINIPSKKKYIFNDKVVIDKDLIINFGDVEFNQNTSIELINNADLIINNSNISFLGTKENLVNIYSNKKSNSSVFIGDSNVIINHTNFSNLSNLNKGFWKLPAAITFYKSNVKIENSNFRSNIIGDDFVNFYRCSNVEIENARFTDIYADAIDSDFSNISVLNSAFNQVNNDAIDVSGSKLSVVNSSFNKVLDKALSVGEKSYATSINNKISNSEMGVVIKDGSFLKDSLSNYNGNKIDLVMFIKKAYFGVSTLDASNVYYNSNLIDLKIPSDKIKNNNLIINYKGNVEELLYGNLYGKASN